MWWSRNKTLAKIKKQSCQNNLLILEAGRLLEKTLDRIKNKIFDYPIISTNIKYLKHVKNFLKKKN